MLTVMISDHCCRALSDMLYTIFIYYQFVTKQYTLKLYLFVIIRNNNNKIDDGKLLLFSLVVKLFSIQFSTVANKFTFCTCVFFFYLYNF